MKKLSLLFLCFFVGDSFATGIDSNAVNAPCDNATLSKYTGTVNAEIDWEPNTINLSWYDGATKLNVANTSQSCVYDGTITVPPQPTKPGYTFNGWKVIHVPGGFTELQYLESTGTQWIETNIKVTSNVVVNVKARIAHSGYSSGEDDFIGNHYAVDVDSFIVGFWQNDAFYYNKTIKSAPLTSNDDLLITNVPLNTPIDIEATFYPNSGTIVANANGNERTFTTSRGSYNLYNNSNVTLFARGTNNLPYAFYGKIYNLQLTVNGVVVGNFIPAKRNNDNVVGMYDTVTDTFFTNSGTGTFIAGPVVQ